MSSERWYYHSVTGDRARREGDLIILDRPNERIEKPFDENVWVPDRESRPLPHYAIAQVAFAADAAFCKAIGDAARNKGDWLSLSDKHRMLWRDKGPTKDPMRAKLYQAVKDALREFGDIDAE